MRSYRITYHADTPAPWWVRRKRLLGRTVYRAVTLLEAENYVTRWAR